MPGGELGSPSGLIARWQRNIESDRDPHVARSVIALRFCFSCDRGSSIHDCLAVMHQPIEGGGGRRVVKAKSRGRTAVVDVQIAQFQTEAKRTNEVRYDELLPKEGGRCK